MVSGRSAARATWYGLPLSSDSSCASSSACFSIKSASLFINTPRCEAPILRHEPLSNAARAAATALSTSAASASATCVITSPVDGLIVGNVFPEMLSTHFPLIRSFVGPILTFRSITAVAVAILTSSLDGALPEGGYGARPLKPRHARAYCEKEAYTRGRMEARTSTFVYIWVIAAPSSSPGRRCAWKQTSSLTDLSYRLYSSNRPTGEFMPASKIIKNNGLVISALHARSNFGQLLRRVAKDSRGLVIEKRGTPRAILLSIREYVRLASPEPEVLRALGKESKQRGTGTLTSRQIDRIIKMARARKTKSRKSKPRK